MKICDFNKWCDLYLPTIFGEELSFYEKLCAIRELLYKHYIKMETLSNDFMKLKNYVDNYFNNLDLQNEINNKLDSMAQDGTLSQIFIEIFGTNQLVNTVYYSLIAKVIPDELNIATTDWSPQGFCIVNKNNISYSVNGFTNSVNGLCKIKIYNMISGGMVIEKTGVWGHINDITYNPTTNQLLLTSYAAATPTNSIVILDFDTLNTVQTINYSLPAIYGIAYNKGLYYVRKNPNIVEVYSNLNSPPIKSFNLYYSTNSIFQSIEVDDNYIFIPHGNHVSSLSASTAYKNPLQQIDVYTHNGVYIKTLIIPIPNEVEGLSFIGKQAYLNVNSLNTGIIVKADIYYDQDLESKVSDLLIVDPNPVNYNVTLWVNQNDTQFFMDGSEAHPLLFVNLLWLRCGFSYKNRLTVNIMSDVTNAINLWRSNYFWQITINCNNHTIPYLVVADDLRVTVNDAIFVNKYNSGNATVYCINNSNVVLNNCAIQSDVDTQYGIYISFGTILEINNCTINDNYQTAIYSGLETFINIGSNNVFPNIPLQLNNYLINRTSLSENLLYNTVTQGNLRDAPLISVKPNMTIDIAKVALPCVMDVSSTSNVTWINAPVLDSGYRLFAIQWEYIKFNTIKCTVYAYKSSPLNVVEYVAYRVNESLSAWKLSN